MSASCESCHGNADQHIKAGGSKETILSFNKGTKRTPDELNKQCLSCHKNNSTVQMWETGMHKKSGVACSSCHGIHNEKNAKSASTCLDCHKDVKRDVQKLSHHPIIEGKVSCSDCHNPHGTGNPGHGQLKAANLNQLCYKCHSDKRGPYVWEHAPVEENCGTCHTPHGSRYQSLLSERVPALCQTCHTGSHPGRPYGGNITFAASNGYNAVGRACLNCHSRIHGSNGATDPSHGYNGGKFFVR